MMTVVVVPVAFVVVAVGVFEQAEIISEVGQLASVGFVLMMTTQVEVEKVEVRVF